MIFMKKISFFFDSTLIFATLFLLSILSLFEIKTVSGHSMLSSFRNEERLLIFRAMYGLRSSFFNRYLIRWKDVEIGDVVVFKIRGRYIIKRCLATEKDDIFFYQQKKDNGKEYFMRIKDVSFPLNRSSYYRLFIDCPIENEEGVQRVPKGSLLLLGDNIDESFDSREYGYIKCDGILGKVIKWK